MRPPPGWLLPKAWEFGLPAICREPAATPMSAVCLEQRCGWFYYRCAADRRQVGLPRPLARIKKQAVLDQQNSIQNQKYEKQRPAECLRSSAGWLLPKAWEFGLPTICRGPAVNPMNAVCRAQRSGWFYYRCAADRRQVGLPRPLARIKSRLCWVSRVLARLKHRLCWVSRPLARIKKQAVLHQQDYGQHLERAALDQ